MGEPHRFGRVLSPPRERPRLQWVGVGGDIFMTSKTSVRVLALAAAAAAAMTLSACGNNEGGEKGSPSVAAASGSEQVQQKFSLYIEGFNKLIDDSWGVSSNFENYQKIDIPNARADGSINFPENITTLETAIAKIKEGRAVRGGSMSQAADAAADKVIAQGEALLAQWKELDPYYEARAYREDGLAKGKAAHPALMTAYQGTLAAINELDTALTTYLRARDEARLEAYRKAGHNDAAAVMDVMQKADHFSTAVIENDKAKADELLPSLEAALAELRKSEAAMKSDDPNKIEFSQILTYVTAMVGYWRDYKQSGSDNYREYVVDNYNRAVDQVNDLELPA